MAEHIGESLHPRDPRTKDKENILDPRTPRKSQQQTDGIANYLVEKYNSPQFRPLFLKAAWRLTEDRINKIVESSMKATSPRAYFIKSVKNDRAYNT